MIRQAPCSEDSSAGAATKRLPQSSSRVDAASRRWPSSSSTTSTGWLPDAYRLDITGTLVGGDAVNDQTVGGSQGYHVVATAIDTVPIGWSVGMAGMAPAVTTLPVGRRSDG
jgi:hypothetical protein